MKPVHRALINSFLFQVETDYEAPIDLTVRGHRVILSPPAPPPPPKRHSSNVANAPPPAPPNFRSAAAAVQSTSQPHFAAPVQPTPSNSHQQTLGELGRRLLGIALTA
jgi:hypothetical protein